MDFALRLLVNIGPGVAHLQSRGFAAYVGWCHDGPRHRCAKPWVTYGNAALPLAGRGDGGRGDGG